MNIYISAEASVSAISGVALTLILTYGFNIKLFGILNAQSTGILLRIVIMMFAFPAKAFINGQKEVKLE